MKEPDPDRDEIKNRDNMKRINNFSGLHFGKITPMDIDGFIDFHNKVFVFIETKYLGGQMKRGQRLALERLVSKVKKDGSKGIAIVAEYENEEGDIDCAKAVVTEYHTGYKWTRPRVPLNVRDAIDRFVALAEAK